jgi:Transposase IS4
MPYDFLIYQGSATEINQEIMRKFGFRKAVVLHMAKRIANPGHKLYVDNYFSKYQVFEVLKELKINAAGTLWIDLHIHHFSLIRKWKSKVADFLTRLKAVMESREESRDGKVILIKCQDNKPVFFGSNFVGKSVNRWDKTKKVYVPVQQPEVIQPYGYGYGWSSFLDQLISFYRIFMKSKKWTIRVISHFSDFAVCAKITGATTRWS